MPLFPPQDFRSTEQTHRQGLAADRPAAADVLIGTLYFSTDTVTLERSNGTTWDTYSGGGGPPGPTGKTGSGGPPAFDGQDGEDGFPYPPQQGTQGLQGLQGIPGINAPLIIIQEVAEEPEHPYIIPGAKGDKGDAGGVGSSGSPGTIGPPGIDAEEPEYPYIIPGPIGKTGPAGGGGGGGTATTIEVDLSATPTWRGKFTITDATIAPTSKILAWQAPGPYTGKGTRADEAELQPVSIIAVNPATGTAEAFWQTPPYLSMKPDSGPTLSLTIPVTVKDNKSYMNQVPTRLGKVRGNVKFSYMVL